MVTITTNPTEILISSVETEPQILFVSYKSGFDHKSKTAILKKGLSVFSIKAHLPNNVEFKVFPLKKSESKKSLEAVASMTDLISRLSWLSVDARREGEWEGGDEKDFKRSEQYKEIIENLFDISSEHLEEERQELLDSLESLKKSEVLSKKIKHESDGWNVYSEDGEKHLGGPYKTKDQAVKRLREVEYFKQHDK